MYVWDVPGSVEDSVDDYVSPHVEAVLGYSADEWLATPHLWIDSLHPDDREEVLDETARSVEAGEPFKLEYRMLARNGDVVWIHDVASVLSRDPEGRGTRYQGVQLDITARKEAEHAQRRSWNELASLHQERRALLERLVGAQEQERERISEGIHDDTLQRLFTVETSLGRITREHPDLGGVDELSGLRRDLSAIIQGLRQLSFDLHPLILDTEGLRSALRSLVERASAARPDVDHRLEDRLDREPSREIALTMYRIAQEALTNAHRHGQMSVVTLTLEDGRSGMLIRIEDDGRGFDADTPPEPPEHMGLRTMRERAEAVGGRLAVRSTPGAGTTVECWLPREVALARRHEPPSPPVTIGSLSAREQEVAELLALGHTNAEIAAILHLSVRTIEHHRSRVFRKIGVRSRAGLVQAFGRARDR